MKRNVWEVVRNRDDAFEILRDGQPLKTSVPDKWLEAELANYGFCGQEYRDIRAQLDVDGKAIINLSGF